MAAPDERTLVQVGDRWLVDGKGEREIIGISVCLQPMRDPAAEEFSAEVDSVEFSAAFVVDLEGGGWAYKSQLRGLVAAAHA